MEMMAQVRQVCEIGVKNLLEANLTRISLECILMNVFVGPTGLCALKLGEGGGRNNLDAI